jgi:hypothetical protein
MIFVGEPNGCVEASLKQRNGEAYYMKKLSEAEPAASAVCCILRTHTRIFITVSFQNTAQDRHHE